MLLFWFALSSSELNCSISWFQSDALNAPTEPRPRPQMCPLKCITTTGGGRCPSGTGPSAAGPTRPAVFSAALLGVADGEADGLSASGAIGVPDRSVPQAANAVAALTASTTRAVLPIRIAP